MLRPGIGPTAVLLFVVAAASPAADSPKTEADPLIGTWQGVHTAHGEAYRHVVKVQKQGQQHIGMGITFFALTEDQAKAVLAGQPKPPGIMPTSKAVQQQFLVTLDGETVTFRGGWQQDWASKSCGTWGPTTPSSSRPMASATWRPISVRA